MFNFVAEMVTRSNILTTKADMEDVLQILLDNGVDAIIEGDKLILNGISIQNVDRQFDKAKKIL